jgi:hypothetical protein
MNEVTRKVVLVELVQVKVSQIVVGDVLGEHVIDRGQDLVGDGNGGPFVPTPSLEPVKLVS